VSLNWGGEKMNTVKALCDFMDKNGIDFYLNEDRYRQAFIIYDGGKMDIVEQEWHRLCNLKTSDKSKYDVNFFYNDSCVICDGCGKIISTETYDKPDYYIDYEYCSVSCRDCVKKDPENYLDYLNNNTDSANVLLTEKEMNENGYYLLETGYENGLYEGMNDSPKTIFERLEKTYSDIIFSISSLNPFMLSFDVYIKNEVTQ